MHLGMKLLVCCHVAVTLGFLLPDDLTKDKKEEYKFDHTLQLTEEELKPESRTLRSTNAKLKAPNSAPPASTSSNSDRELIRVLTRQLMMQQMAAEERSRTDGDSGIKQVRHGTSGTESYYSPSHVGSGPASIHDHANNIRTIGMGEIVAVLNGLEFRTRHNDYQLVMPHRTSSEYHAVEKIPFPAVPPEVSNKTSVEDQIAEMREWFKAWKNQDHSLRDYRQYFKPVLCYLEGAWTFSEDQIDEPFFSDRHFIDANSWFELQEKVQFTTYTGRKSALENYAYLPTKIVGISNESLPILSQWNYRILCQPLKRDLPLNRFQLVEDLRSRLSRGYTFDELKDKRAARFRLNQYDTDDSEKDGFIRFGLIDELMRGVPGKDNHQGNITDDAFDKTAHDLAPQANESTLNAAFYHRWNLFKRKDAMGSQIGKRGFSDDNMFVALSEQNRIAGRSVSICKGRRKKRVCKKYEQKTSYAIPLEVIYMTPLSQWNPYNLAQKGNPRLDEGKTVSAGGRNGKRTPERAFNGTNDRTHFLTPNAFFKGREVNSGAADTSRNSIAVLDQDGKMRLVRASGHRIFLPYIEGVGVLRQRYPIMPIHAEGSAIWKELDALREIVMNPNKYANFLQEKVVNPGNGNNGNVATTAKPAAKGISLEMSVSRSKTTTAHKHRVTLTAEQFTKLKNGETVTVKTSEENSHSHKLQIKYELKKNTNKTKYRFIIDKCDTKTVCWDRHGKVLSIVSTD